MGQTWIHRAAWRNGLNHCGGISKSRNGTAGATQVAAETLQPRVPGSMSRHPGVSDNRFASALELTLDSFVLQVVIRCCPLITTTVVVGVPHSSDMGEVMVLVI